MIAKSRQESARDVAFSATRELADMALGHAIGNQAEAAYRRGKMLERKRRAMMQDWALHCGHIDARGLSWLAAVPRHPAATERGSLAADVSWPVRALSHQVRVRPWLLPRAHSHPQSRCTDRPDCGSFGRTGYCGTPRVDGGHQRFGGGVKPPNSRSIMLANPIVERSSR